MSEDGYVAPMTSTADGEIIDGSARLERAYDKFAGDVIVIEHDGTRPIIARRTDIANAQTVEAKRIAFRANRIAQADLEWDSKVLASLQDDGLIEGMFTAQELAAISTKDEAANTSEQLGELEYRIVVKCKNEGEQMELSARFEAEGLTCQLLIS
jgi:hypothetical protein